MFKPAGDFPTSTRTPRCSGSSTKGRLEGILSTTKAPAGFNRVRPILVYVHSIVCSTTIKFLQRSWERSTTEFIRWTTPSELKGTYWWRRARKTPGSFPALGSHMGWANKMSFSPETKLSYFMLRDLTRFMQLLECEILQVMPNHISCCLELSFHFSRTISWGNSSPGLSSLAALQRGRGSAWPTSSISYSTIGSLC